MLVAVDPSGDISFMDGDEASWQPGGRAGIRLMNVQIEPRESWVGYRPTFKRTTIRDQGRTGR